MIVLGDSTPTLKPPQLRRISQFNQNKLKKTIRKTVETLDEQDITVDIAQILEEKFATRLINGEPGKSDISRY
jgi:hypothetical protein